MASRVQEELYARKRPLPSSSDLSIPPNKKIYKPMEKEQKEKHRRERELIHQRSVLESKAPFYLQPRVQLPFPLIPSKPNPYLNSMSPVYPYLPTPSTPSTESSSHKSPYSVSNLIGESTPKSPFVGYPFTNSPQTFKHSQGMGLLSPWSPLQNGLITGLPTPPSNEELAEAVTYTVRNHTNENSVRDKDVNITADVFANENGKKISTSTSSYSFSPYPHPSHGANFSSPFLYMYNNSPLSPMVLLGSPCGPSSVNSVPSVSSSSGCSSMSEGSMLSVDQSKQNLCRIAPSEYHVGIKPSSQTIIGTESDSASRTSDFDDTDDERAEVDIERVESYSNLNSDPSLSAQTTSNSCAASSSGISDSCPLSVQSLISNEPQALSIGSCQQGRHIGRSSPVVSCVSSPSSSHESTPEPEDNEPPSDDKPDLKTTVDGDDVFCLVPGRLSLLSATQKYQITVDEVRRRLLNPECLNASVLGGILRRAKSKNGGHHLRQRLEEKGLSLPPGRRKATDITLFTSLVEGEALHLASDYRRLCQHYFPHRELAQIIGRQHANTPHAQKRIQMIEATKVLLSELQAMVDTVGGPANVRPDDPMNPYPGLTTFGLISHGFGNPSISTALSVVQTYLQELEDIYEGRKPHQQSPFPLPPNSMPPSVPSPIHVGNLPSAGNPLYGRPCHSQLFSPPGHAHLMRPSRSIHNCNSMKQEPKDL